MKKLICCFLIALTSLGAIAQEKHHYYKPQPQRHHYVPQPQYYGPVIPDNRREWGAFLLGSVLAAPVYTAPPAYTYTPQYNPYPRTCWEVEQWDAYRNRLVIRTLCN